MWALIKTLTIAICCCVFAVPTANGRDVALNSDGSLLFTANSDAKSISKIDTGSLAKLGEFNLKFEPESLALDSQERIWVTFRRDDMVGVFDSTNGATLALFKVGDEPYDVIPVSVTHVAVSLYQAESLLLVNNSTFAIDDSVPTLPHPRGLAISADGQILYSTHFRSGTLTIVDITTWEVDNTIQPEADGNLSQNVAITADGTKAYLPLTRSNVSNPTLVFDGTVFPLVSVIDLANEIALPGERISLDIVDEPVGIPLDIAITDTHFFILNAGSNDLTVINRTSGITDAHLELGANPRSMALSADNNRLFVHNRLSGTLSVVDTTSLLVIDEVPVADNLLPANLLNGKRIFNDSNRSDLARDQWISCATCHFDGETDGRTWFFPDGPRNTPSLLGSNVTGPYHWSGDLDELHDVEATVRDIQAGSGLADGLDNCSPACDQAPPNAGRSQNLDDLAEFMTSLRLNPNPNLGPDGLLMPAAARGEALFRSPDTGCASCHPAPLFLDGLNHDIGTGGEPGERKGPDFNTPSLRGIFSTAPYLHDGRAATLMDVLTTHNPSGQHGTTSGLSQGELEDLVAFLNSLTFPVPMFRSGFE
jgi:YVTN family beta-propeller protein